MLRQAGKQQELIQPVHVFSFFFSSCSIFPGGSILPPDPYVLY
jgi:hypothetical protein